ncbi:ADP-heptose--LPS-heptosyltransferase II [Escherichia coli]|uniref:ADP-heptose--LPS-heptosyltransferase II n=1 Tax=Escherichia coli TaxID=562 RepID=A0A376ML08_ECOLX|nr:ADP-heptose--LPS-heptosyltransferase II [Escherichia coli]
MKAGNEILAALNTEQQAWCRNLAGETQLDQAVILIAACKAIVTKRFWPDARCGGAQSSAGCPVWSE